MRMSMMRLIELAPFSDLTITFPEKTRTDLAEVQIITGENGTGKTRLLCAISELLGNPQNLTERTSDDESVQFAGIVSAATLNYGYLRSGAGVYSTIEPDNGGLHSRVLGISRTRTESAFQPGSRLDSFSQAGIKLGEFVTAIALGGAMKVREAKVEALKPMAVTTRESKLDLAANDHSLLVCQAMTNLKLQSAMEHLSQLNGDGRAIKIVERLEATVSRITGKKFSFDITPHPELRIRVKWGDEKIRFGALPDGLRSIIGWLVAAVSRLTTDFPEHNSPLDIPAVVLVDEPETHLHPAWQRRLIPAAQQLLPNAQFIIVTHSPMIVSSINSGWIHVLRFQDGQVVCSEPKACSSGDTYIDAMEDALGMKSWYDPETESMLEGFRAMRSEVLAGSRKQEELVRLAGEIAKRSESLQLMMGREIQQVSTLMATSEN